MIDITEMTDDERSEFKDEHNIGFHSDVIALGTVAEMGKPPIDCELVTTQHGETKAEALGHSMHLRDKIRENTPKDAEVEYIEAFAEDDDKTYHKVRLVVGEGE